MKVREASLPDTTGIARVHVDGWRNAYRGIVPENILDGLSYEQKERQWEETFRRTTHQEFVYVAEDETGHIIGFASGGPALDNNDFQYRGELFTLYILETYQRQGLGHRLFFQVVERLLTLELTSMLIWVLAENPARRFYEALGGNLVKTGNYEIKGVKLQQVAYGWSDLTQLRRAS